MKMYLAMMTADGEERRFRLRGDRVVLGRDRGCDLRVALPSVSLRHCEIVIGEDAVRLNDLGSESGTFHNGARIEHAELAADDEVTLGSMTFVVRNERTGDAAAVAEVKPETRESPPARTGGRPTSAKNKGE